jgi:hypothetical protein
MKNLLFNAFFMLYIQKISQTVLLSIHFIEKNINFIFIEIFYIKIV